MGEPKFEKLKRNDKWTLESQDIKKSKFRRASKVKVLKASQVLNAKVLEGLNQRKSSSSFTSIGKSQLHAHKIFQKQTSQNNQVSDPIMWDVMA